MDNNEYLPIGTVVLLKGAEKDKELMIIGYNAKVKTEDGEVFAEYMACPHPYGIKGMDYIRFFNRDNIDKIIDMGYVDEDFTKLKGMLQG